MTVPAAERKAGPFNGNGSTTAFPFTFKVFTTEDIEVIFADTDGVETVLELDSDYSVSLNADQDEDPGGTVTYPISGAALATGEKLSIAGALPYEQETDIPTGGNFNPTVLENALDKLSMQTQQLAESVSRAAKVPITNAADADTLTQAILVAANNIAGLEVVVANISDIQTVADDLNEGTSEINTVATSIANVNIVGADIDNVNAVAANETNIDAVAANETNIDTVAGINANVTTVAGIAANVTTVAGVAANVTTVAGISAAVSAVATNNTDVSTVATNIADVGTVADDIADINSCADNMAAILDAPAQASAAAASAAAAAASLDNFDDRYLGAKNSAPTVDNDGNALVAGALYFNTGVSVADDKGMWIYDGGTWIQASAASQAILVRYKYVATAAQTTFTGADANGLTLSYTAGSIIVTLNGVVMDAADYTATTGNSVVLASGAAASDEVCVFAFSTFDIANAVAKSGDSMSGNLGFSGTGLRITGDMSNATAASRLALQSSTTNGSTIVNALPNGTGINSQFRAHNSSDPANAGIGIFGITDTQLNIASTQSGTGSYLPISIQAGGSERAKIETTGQRKSTIIGGGGGIWDAFDCRAWVNFNGAGTVAIRASGNVSSITDNGTGDYTVNFTTAMPDADYSTCFGSSHTWNSTNGDQGWANLRSNNGGTSPQQTSGVRIWTSSKNSGLGGAVDNQQVNVSIHR